MRLIQATLAGATPILLADLVFPAGAPSVPVQVLVTAAVGAFYYWMFSVLARGK